MVRAHRQAWAWQDEWFGLSIDDIRHLEAETQEALAQRMTPADCPPASPATEVPVPFLQQTLASHNSGTVTVSCP